MQKSLILSVLTIIVIGGAAYYLSMSTDERTTLLENSNWDLRGMATTTLATPGVAEAIANISKEPPAGHVKYVNSKYGFYYYHSPETTITEYDEGGGAMTVVQENAAKMRGLQIFIVPYADNFITEERFLRDVPSGVRYNIENTTVGEKRIPAVTFNSHDEFLGETRELWFIYNGYLYEITTFKGFGDWFAPIMQTWRFV